MSFPCRSGMVSLVALALLLTQSTLHPARGEASSASSKKTAGANCDREQFRVIIDVGHSAEVPGALSARGVPEYEFNLQLAKNIERKLRDAGFSKTVLLITPGKALIGLVKRATYATHSPADLFLSIHHDAVPDSFLEKWEYEGKKNHFSDRFSGHSIFVSQDNSEFKASLLFGKLLGNQLKNLGLKYTPHYIEKFMGRRQRQLVDAEAGVYRYDQLVVLRSTQMPAVLLEAGSIVNREEELLLATPEHQTHIGSAVANAVESFCLAQSLRKPEQRIARRPPAP